MSKKRPIETIVLSDSDSDREDQVGKLTPPPRHIPHGASNERVAVTIQDEEEDVELQAAIRASLEEAAGKGEVININQQERIPPIREQQQGSTTSSNNTLLGGLNRAEMEKARLERVAKLDSSSQQSSFSPSSSFSSASGNYSNKRSRIATLSDLSSSTSSSSTSNPSSSSSEQRFFSGEIRRVYNRHDPFPPPLDTSTFSSLIGSPSTLVGSIISSYVWDLNWVLNHFPSKTCKDVPILLIMPRPNGDNEKEGLIKVSGKWDLEKLRPQGTEGTGNNYLREVYRSIPRESREVSYGCMHIKFLVFFHDDYCRIVIPTANAIEYDWSIIDNAFYVQDFPLLKQESSKDSSPWENPTLSQFSSNFITIVNKLGANKAFLSLFKPYDFTKSSDVRLVHSIQGKYTTPESLDKGGGFASLSKSVESLNFNKDKSLKASDGDWEIEVTGSSISRYSPTWLIQFLSSCQGIHPTSYFTHSLSRPNSKTSPLYPLKPNPPLGRGQSYDYSKLPLKILFPTKEEILNSYEGVEGGGTIFFPKTRWSEKNFPKSLLYKGKSKRDRVAAHTKMILASHKIETKEGIKTFEGFVYVGSHNFTTSAWGQLQDGQSGVKQLLVNNYELGVIVPVKGCQTERDFEEKVNKLVSYKRTPSLEKFGMNDVPWMQDDFPEIYKKDQPTRPGGKK
ncbi:hypothetical protein JCM5350_002254 [Sporobolomyces pararoseus]